MTKFVPLPVVDSFFKAYVECALWSSTGDDGQPLDKRFSIDNIEPATLAKMQTDCLAFYTEFNLGELPDSEQRRAGHDFWLTRNGHGSGFWDGDWNEPQASLMTIASHHAGNFDLYQCDDESVLAGTPLNNPEQKDN